MLGMQATNQKMTGFGRFYSLLFFLYYSGVHLQCMTFWGRGIEVHKTS